MKTEEDEAFEAIERRQGGFQAKRQMAADKLQEPVLDLDGHVVREPRKRVPKPKAQPAQEPVACVMGTYGGMFVVGPLNSAVVLPVGMALYATPQHTATWVGLTDADIERIKLMTYEKETNADGEEQEAVNIDWLIKTTEHFCKEKNNGA